MIWVLFGSLAFFLAMGVPVAFSIGLSSLAYLVVKGFPPVSVISQRMVMGIDSFPLLALPLFMIAGVLMEKGSTPRLMRLANALIGHITGGLAAVAVAASCFFGAVSGSGVATVAAVGSIMEPEMVKRGYGKGFTASLLGGSGGLGIVIPPSLSMVVYGVAGGVSIAALFLGGFIPGILAGLFLIAFSIMVSAKRGYRGTDRRASFKELVEAFRGAIGPLAMPVIIMGGVLGGVFTPTEAAVVAAVYAFVLAVFVYKELKWSEVPQLLAKASLSSATIILIVSAAAPFAWIMASEHIPEAMASALLSISSNKIVLLFAINVLLLFLGTFMETIAVIIIMTPILLPIVTHIGIDPVHFGVAMMLNLAIGGATPPLAVGLFTSTRIIGISIEETFPDIIWVCLVMTLALAVILLIPETALLLPNLLLK
ncbi:MAG: TRAP transporter large permease [Bacillota bacterium]|nr:TRAP transporter large permease [Bacillota bacterium]